MQIYEKMFYKLVATLKSFCLKLEYGSFEGLCTLFLGENFASSVANKTRQPTFRTVKYQNDAGYLQYINILRINVLLACTACFSRVGYCRRSARDRQGRLWGVGRTGASCTGGGAEPRRGWRNRRKMANSWRLGVPLAHVVRDSSNEVFCRFKASCFSCELCG